MRLLLASLLGCCTLWRAYAQPASDLLAREFGLKGAVINLYAGTDLQPAVIVRLDQTYRDYERKGFFRIGLLPMGVFEGVTFEFPHQEFVTNGLAQVHRWLGPKAARRLELRRVAFLMPGPVTNRLESGRARLVVDGKLALLDGVNFMSGTNEMRAAHAVLQVTGAQAGQLVMETTSPWTNNLFSRFETP